MATKYKLNKKDGSSILKVIAYAGVSAAIAALIAIIPQIEVSNGMIVFLIPVINTALVAAKKFFENN